MGRVHSCALLTNGIIRCWGYNGYGQLGDETTTNRITPGYNSFTEVSGITTATSIALGGDYSCALLADGTMKCWGSNDYGQLGDGTTTNSTIPVEVSGITTATSIAMGRVHSCALLTDGTVKCWGRNNMGQLGDNTTIDASYTISEVSGITTATSIALDGDHSCALLTDGTMKCWGLNDYGHLGDGTTTNRATPVEVSGLYSSPPPPSPPPTSNTTNVTSPPSSNTTNVTSPPSSNNTNVTSPPSSNTTNVTSPPSSNNTNVTSPSASNTTNVTSPPSSNATAVPPPPPNATAVPPPPSSNATAVPPPPSPPPTPPSPSPPPPPKSFVFLADYESSAGRVSVLTALVVSLLSALFCFLFF